MSSQPKAKILIFTTGEGHLSLARAANSYLSPVYQTKVINYPFKRILSVYRQFYLYFPSLIKIPYKLAEKKRIAELSIKIYEKSFYRNVKKDIARFKPDLIISTYTVFNSTVANFIANLNYPIPFINIVANPQILPIEFATQADLNIVYDKSGIVSGKKNRLSAGQLKAIGWLTESKFYEKKPVDRILKQLGFSKKIFTILICGGSEGTNAIVKILPALLLSRKPIQVIVVCGHNKTLLKRLKTLQNFYQKLSSSKQKLTHRVKFNKNVRLKLFGSVKNMASLLQVSDLVIGKAGPNLLFETVACKKPFMAIAHISGQEDANLEIIKNKGLGLVEEKPIKAIKLLQKIIDQPSILKKFAPTIRAEAACNLQAGEKLKTTIATVLKKKSRQK